MFGPSHRSGVAASLMGVLVNRGEQLTSGEFLTPTEAGLQESFNLQLGDPELSSLLEAVRSLYVGAHTAEYLSAAHGELQILQAYREIVRHVVAGEEHAALGLLYCHPVLLKPARPDLAAAMRETAAELSLRSSGLPKVCRESASFLRAAALVADSSNDNPIDVSEVAQCLGSMDPSSHQAVIRASNTAFDEALSLAQEVTIDELEIRSALASPNAGMRRVAYYKARKSPAFRSVDESWGDAFYAYVEFLRELYETGMADPDTGVRAASVILGRRIIYGLSNRDEADLARAWSARIVRDTQDATEPALIRARLLAQQELAVELPDEEHRRREMRKLLERMGPAEIDSDAHACVRADVLLGLASSTEGDELWPLAFAGVEAAVLAYPRDEYQQYDFHSLVGTWGLWTATKRYEAGDVERWLRVLDQIAPFMNYFSSTQQERYQLLLWQLVNAPDEYPQRAEEITQIQRRIFPQTELTHPNELLLLQARRALSLANERVSAADPGAPTQSTQAATVLVDALPGANDVAREDAWAFASESLDWLYEICEGRGLLDDQAATALAYVRGLEAMGATTGAPLGTRIRKDARTGKSLSAQSSLAKALHDALHEDAVRQDNTKEAAEFASLAAGKRPKRFGLF
ncbi:hypothetical protein EG850_01495 [Gulosibacter macacae]|uniref:Uncharacterized protein n=1 Tax=Gulosibacter macacae TaxID=2488791 RepID=A0A3P3W381_9MICO|nr:hypothetical protein [Gulosibacter macacae]RRJ88838.1 hypothetical protein EG850_01495 [Gulosibacter macacae]